MERSIWRQGRKVVRGMQSKGSVNFGIIRNYVECTEVCEMVRRLGNRVAELGFEYFGPDYVSKIGVSVTECNREPDTFEGLDANKLQVFILQCSLHFQDCANTFSTDRAKVAYALSYLTGPALGWLEPGLFALSPPAWVHHWDLFHIELESNFGPFDPVREAEAEIETLVMAKGSRSVTYFVEFNHLVSHIQWGDHALCQGSYPSSSGHPHLRPAVPIFI